MMAVIDRGNPDMRQGREEIVQQSVPTAIWIKQNLLRAAQPTFKKPSAPRSWNNIPNAGFANLRFVE
jgi:hypothetical protein